VAKVTMPQLGESVAEGTVGRWLKKPGDTVAKYEPLLEVITDKVNAEVPSPFAGVLKEILVEEGATVPNNAEIAVIETEDEAGAGSPASATTAKQATTQPESGLSLGVDSPAAPTGARAEPAHGPAGSDERPTREPERAAAMASTAAPAAQAPDRQAPVQAPQTPHAGKNGEGPTGPGDPNARMTPAVRRLLREHGLDAAMIIGTGGGRRITREDVTDYVEAQRTGKAVGSQDPAGAAARSAGATVPAPSVAGTGPAGAPGAAAPAAPPAPAPAPTAPTRAPAPSAPSIAFPDGADEMLLPMTQMRKGISAQMTRALAVPHAYVQMEIDATKLVKLREKAKKEYQAREGTSLSYVPFVVKAAVAALKKNPAFNAHWTDQGVLAKRRINIGVAVAVDDGLLVPVIRDVDALSIAGLNRAIADVAARARANKLRIDDFGGGTFTIDNTGYLGTNMVMPIINVPEVAILTMEAITKRPVVQETPDGDVIAIRPIMNMVLAIDHRANDGAQAAAFLRDVKTWLESVGPDLPIW
jgi:pyruvate/2-oxoglutarate dehydrogenase complex dihydrolipoamide acyltransferase (E2) component